MKPLTLEEIRRNIHGVRLTAGNEAVAVSGVSIDSRTARPGELFLAIVGENFDGHYFLPAAAKAGCIGAVVCRGALLPEGLDGMFGAGVIGVEDTRAALGELAGYCRRQLAASVIGVTGSNGKTTVKRMIHHILSRRLRGSASPKSFNNEIGVPLTLLAAEPGDDYVICEIGANASGEIANLSRMAAPNVAVITSVAETHLEGLGSLEGVAMEKAAILLGLDRGGLGVVCGGCEPLDRALRGYDARVIRFGDTDDASLRLTAYEPAADGCRFEMNGRLWADLPLPGRHNALNALAAMAVAQRFGMAAEEAAAALADLPAGPMRLERIECGAVTVFNDAYNANPASLLAAAAVLAETPAARRVLVVGDMKELGERAEALHEDTGRRVAARGLDLLVAVGPLGRYIARGAAAEGMETVCFDTVEDASAGLGGLLKPGDVVLLKGSRSMRMERLVEPVCSAPAAAQNAGEGRKR